MRSTDTDYFLRFKNMKYNTSKLLIFKSFTFKRYEIVIDKIQRHEIVIDKIQTKIKIIKTLLTFKGLLVRTF